MSQELIFTTLPNQRISLDGKEFLKLSVFCSARLTSAQNTTLQSFPDVLSWPELIASADYKFKFGSLELEAQLLTNAMDPDFFGHIFHNQIRVKSYKQDNFTEKNIHSVPIVHIKDFIFNNYQKLAIDSPTKLVTADKFIDSVHFGSINRIKLNEQEINKVNNDTAPRALKMKTLATQDVAVDKQLKTDLRKNKFVKFSAKMNPETDFAQLRKFHRIDEQMKPFKPIVIQKPEFEFHDIISIATNYPQIARRLGFILDFLVPFDGTIPVTNVVTLITNDLQFTNTDTVVSAPPTAYQLTSKGFYAADKPNSVFKQGFVRINTPEFTVLQMDADGAAIKTQQITESKTKEVAEFYKVRSEVKMVMRKGKTNARGQHRVKDVKKAQPPVEEGLPAMRSAGIAIVKNGMAEHVFKKFEIAKTLQPKLLNLDLALKVQPKANLELSSKKLKVAQTLTPMRHDRLKMVQMAPIKLIYPAETLYSDDIVQGYRMDIAYEEDPNQWFSLHQRKNEYKWYDNQNKAHNIEIPETDEGFIELAMTENPDDPNDVFISETLARWEGWSLSVTRPGFAINEAADDPSPNKRDFVNTDRNVEMKKYAFDPNLEFKMNMQSKSIPGTLPRLRFGKDYRVRIRTVDLAGNSIPLGFIPESTTDTIRTNIRYMRYEPLSSPIVLVGNELKDGEFLESMVIRSNYDQSANDYENLNLDEKDFPDYSQRYLLPPKNSQMIAEAHGKFEKAMGNNPLIAQQIYKLITDHEGLYKRPEKTVEKVYQPNEVEIIYLPDPMAAGVALFVSEGFEHTHTQEFSAKMFSFFSSEELSSDKTNTVEIPDDWYHAKHLRIRLEEGELGSKWNSSERVFTVFLPKGYRTRIKYSTFWREADFKKMSAIWQMIKEKNPSNLTELEKVVRSGQHWMMSPPREFELVHAVQQPVEIPEIKNIIPDRDFGETFVDLHTKFKVHGESTEKVSIQAKWTEPIDDGISVEINEAQAGRNMISDIEIQYNDDTLTFGTIPELVLIPAHNQLKNMEKIQAIPLQKHQLRTEAEFKKDPQPGAVKLNKTYQLQNTKYQKVLADKNAAPKNLVNTVKFDIAESKYDFVKMVELRKEPLAHHFGDTKHRWVDYQVVGNTRYEEYFTKILKKNPKLSITRESKWVEKINILSAARPILPEIDYVIPTFEWRKTQNDDTMRHRRMGGGLRIYIKRPWYSTGVDEMLGVILPPKPSGNVTMTMVGTNTSPYTDYYTHWAIDPILYSVQTEKASPQPEDFRLNPVLDDQLQYPGQENLKAQVAAYPVFFDDDKQMWYADIAIDPKNVYFPFVKLAIARYQPFSVKKENRDVCLSPVVLSTFVQLVPERQTTVQFIDKNKSKLKITVEGTIFNERFAKWGNRSFVRISFVDALQAKPIEGVIDSGKNSQNLVEEGLEIPLVQGKNVTNNKYLVTQEISIPATYKEKPYQILIEEFERGPLKTVGDEIDAKYASQMVQNEETDRLIYADVFTVGEK